MQQTVPSKQHTFFEDEDQVTESQNLSVLPYELEEKIEFQEEPSPPAELKEEFPSTKLPRSKRYLKITDAQRRDFIDAVENKGEKIIHAAKLFDINYSSAKSILNIYKSEGRMTKKPTRVKPDGTSPKTPEGNEKPKTVTTATVSTQTHDEEDQELFKESLAYRSEKRSNPYEGLAYHELSRFTGSINDYSGSQLQNSIPELNNKSSPPQNYPPINPPGQPIFTSINYLSLPNVSSISAPSLNQFTPMENSNLMQPGPGLIYPQNNQNLSPESGAPRMQGLNILTAPYSIPQQEFQQSFVTPGGNLDYSQLQRLQQNSGPMKEERPMPEFPNGMKNFAAMSYTGGDNNMSQAQFYQFPIKLNENNSKALHQPTTEIRYLPPIQMVLMPGTNQFDPNNAMIKPMFQMIGSNFVPQQTNYPYYENQNSNNNNNSYPPNNN